MATYPVKDRLKDLMSQHRITQQDLVEELQISEDAVRRKMNGESDWYLRELLAVARILNLSIDDVFIVK